MPISKNLVESHGGRIWLESELGQGSTFFISVPVKSEELVPLFSAPERPK
jgi:signal transduction histidine kinase